MFDYISENKGPAITMLVVAGVLVLFSVVASAYGFGADKPPSEDKRGRSVRSGGGFIIFYGGPGAGARGVGGRGAMGGGFRGGKN